MSSHRITAAMPAPAAGRRKPRSGLRLGGALLAAALLAPGLAACGRGGGGAEAPDGAQPPPVRVTPVPEPKPIEAGRAPAPGPYDPGVDVLHYQIELDLWTGSDTIEGRTTVRFRRTAGGDGRITLDLTGLAVDTVWIGPAATHRLRPVSSDAYRDSLAAGRLPVPFPEGSRVGDTLAVMVRYRGRPDDGLILGKTVHGAPAAFADDWPNRARFWFPSVDHPSDKATATFIVRAPEAWSVVANGAPLSPPTPVAGGRFAGREPRRTWRWDTSAPIPTYTMVVGATDFRTRQLGLAACGQAPRSRRPDGCVEVTSWLYPADTAQAEHSFGRAPQIVDYFTRLIGPFPYEKLANVESSTRFGGMENSSAIFYDQKALASGADIENTVSHETAHQWFGDSVTEAKWSHLWLSEGFATYFSALWTEHADGEAAFHRRMEQNRRTYLASDVTGRPVLDTAQVNLFDLLDANSYQKGAWVLHMLRGLLGDDAFFRGIRTYYREHRDGTALTSDLRSAMEAASGRKLSWFFDQWLRKPGYPVVSTDWSWDASAKQAAVTIRQSQPAAWPAFRLPAQIELTLADGDTLRKSVDVTGRSWTTRIDLPSPPRGVVFDPDGWVLTGPTPGGAR